VFEKLLEICKDFLLIFFVNKVDLDGNQLLISSGLFFELWDDFFDAIFSLFFDIKVLKSLLAKLLSDPVDS
jgi:hypothetical protein